MGAPLLGARRRVDLFGALQNTSAPVATFYDSVCGLPLFKVGGRAFGGKGHRTLRAFEADTKAAGRPVFLEQRNDRNFRAVAHSSFACPRPKAAASSAAAAARSKAPAARRDAAQACAPARPASRGCSPSPSSA